MGGKSKSQVKARRYQYVFEFGYVQSADAFLEFRAGGAEAWSGEITTNGDIQVDALDIWGGDEKEGGIEGTMTIRFGGDAQVADPYLVERIGPEQSGARGYVTAIWKGGTWGSNNYYPKPPETKLRRIYNLPDGRTQWYEGKAELGIPSAPTLERSGPITGMPTTGNRIYSTSSLYMRGSKMWTFASDYAENEPVAFYRLDVRTGEAELVNSNVVPKSGYTYMADGWSDTPAFALYGGGPNNPFVVYDEQGNVLASVSSGSKTWMYQNLYLHIRDGKMFLAMNGLDGSVHHTSGLYEIVSNALVPRVLTGAAVINGETFNQHFAGKTQHYVLTTAKKLYVFDLAWTLVSTTDLSGIGSAFYLSNGTGGSGVVLRELSEGVLIARIASRFWRLTAGVGGEHLGYVTGFNSAYEDHGGQHLRGGKWHEYHIWSGGNNPNALQTVNLFAGKGWINPIHEMHYALTSDRMMGYPVDAIDDASFRAAADKIYAQGLGVCITHDPDSESPKEYLKRLADITGVSVTQNPSSGLWVIDVHDGDYDKNTLPVLTDLDVVTLDVSPSVLDGAANSIVVHWFDQEKKEKRTTAPIQSLAAIESMGGVVTDSIDRPELPDEGLALKYGARELGGMCTPTETIDGVFTPINASSLRAGQYVRLQCPKHGIADAVFLINNIDTGTLLSGNVALSAVEDIYSVPDSVFVSPEPGFDSPEQGKPEKVVQSALFELPYYLLRRNLSDSDHNALTVDDGFIGTVASDPGGLSVNYGIASGADGQTPERNGSGEWAETCLLTAAAGFLDTTLSVDNTSGFEVGTEFLLGGEICIVTGTAANQLTVKRGCADTLPKEHAVGARLWDISQWTASDYIKYTDGQTVSVRLDALGIAGRALAGDTNTVQMDQRQAKPYPPGDVKLNGEHFPTEVIGDLEVTWKNHGRVEQQDNLVGWTEASTAAGGGNGAVFSQFEFLKSGAVQLSFSEDHPIEEKTPRIPKLPTNGAHQLTAKTVDPSGAQPLYSDIWIISFDYWHPSNLSSYPAVYDFTDWATLWQDVAGTIPVTAAGQTVARADDISGNGYHLSQTDPARRPVSNITDGKGCIHFNGTTQKALENTAWNAHGQQSISFGLSAKLGGVGTGARLFAGNYDATKGGFIDFLWTGAAKTDAYARFRANFSAASQLNRGAQHNGAVSAAMSYSASDNTMRSMVDGAVLSPQTLTSGDLTKVNAVSGIAVGVPSVGRYTGAASRGVFFSFSAHISSLNATALNRLSLWHEQRKTL